MGLFIPFSITVVMTQYANELPEPTAVESDCCT
jgi:hypothetical protein